MNELREFLLAHENWEEILTKPPYSLKVSRDDGYILFKYNQLESDFSLPIVREARGIIFREDDMTCVCFPFTKFFNYGEANVAEINWNTAEVQTKIDGSLMKLWCDNNEWHISTNGIINAYKAELNDAKYHSFGELFDSVFDWDKTNNLDGEYTYMFELVSLANKVVIPYSETKLYFLGWRNPRTGQEFKPEDSYLAEFYDIPKRHSLAAPTLDAVVQLAEALDPNNEGFVICDANFNRVKVKTSWYIIHHRLVNNHNTSLKNLIAIVEANEQDEFLIYCAEYSEKIAMIKSALDKIKKNIDDIFQNITEGYEVCDEQNRKQYALLVNKFCKNPIIKSYFFAKYNTNLSWNEFFIALPPNRKEQIIKNYLS